MCTLCAEAPQFIGSCTWLPSGPSNKTHLFRVTRVYQGLLLTDIWVLVDLVSSRPPSSVLLDSMWELAPVSSGFSPKCYFKNKRWLLWLCLFLFLNQKLYLRSSCPQAHVTAVTSMRTSRCYWFLCFIQSDRGVRLDSPNLCIGHLTGLKSMWETTFALHLFLSNTLPTNPYPINPHSTPSNPTKKKKKI